MISLKQIFKRRQVFGDLSEEIRAHLEEKIDALVAAGMSREAAGAAARREFGSATLAEEEGREVWRWNLIESFLIDVRFGVRALRKARGFTMVAILTLALGIGSTTAIFSIIRAVLMNPLAIQDPPHVVLVREEWQDTLPDLSVGNFADIRRQSSSFSSLCAMNEVGLNLATPETPVRVRGELATADCFATF